MTGGEKLHLRYSQMLGSTEWDANVEKIQRWFYGGFVHASWCATSLCYFANLVGLKLGKHENVCELMDACKEASKKGYGRFYQKSSVPETLKKGDILFWLWKGNTMTTTSSKHVGIADCDTASRTVPCLGGNQSKMIRVTNYNKDRLYAVYRPY